MNHQEATKPRIVNDQRLVRPREGDRYTFIGGSGEPRYYTVVNAETWESFAAIVWLRNVDTDRQAMVTKHWMTFPRKQGRWEAGWTGREDS